ncbi:MAG: hypothetical protein LUD50_05450 [Clostridia bacterium]|nr:hypothetical protein [Clostridia bacterium]
MVWYIHLVVLVLHAAVSVVYFLAIHFPRRNVFQKMNTAYASRGPETFKPADYSPEGKKRIFIQWAEYECATGYIVIAGLLLLTTIFSATGGTYDLIIYVMLEALTCTFITAYLATLFICWPALMNKPYKGIRLARRLSVSITVCVLGFFLYAIFAALEMQGVFVFPCLMAAGYIALLIMGIFGLVRAKKVKEPLAVRTEWESPKPDPAKQSASRILSRSLFPQAPRSLRPRIRLTPPGCSLPARSPFHRTLL